jgi:vitamin B12 transporter
MIEADCRLTTRVGGLAMLVRIISIYTADTMTYKTLFPAGAISVAATLSTSLYASDQHLEEVNVTAHRMPVAADQLGSTSISLLGSELREQGIYFVSEALQRAPGVSLASNGGTGALTQIRLRGQEANHTLVLLDGMRINDPVTGFVDLANLRLTGVARIEILYGPQSVLYGTDASGGVIHIITNSGDEQSLGLSAEVGSNQTARVSIAGSFDTDTVYGGLQYSHYQTDGISAASEARGNSEKDGYESDAANIQLGARVNGFDVNIVGYDSKNTVGFDADDLTTGLPIDEAVGFENRQDRHSQYVRASASFASSTDAFRVMIAHTQGKDTNDTSSYSPGYPSWGIPAGMQDYFARGERDYTEATASYRFSEAAQLLVGADLLDEEVGTTYFATQAISSNSVFAQLMGESKGISYSVGLRNDDHDRFGTELSYRGTLRYQLSSDLSIRGSYGTGFKAPSLFELYDFGGNPDLKPETSKGADLGLDWQLNNISLSATLFQQETEQLIRSVGSFPNSRMENVDSSKATGLELQYDQQFSSTWQLNANYTFTDAKEYNPQAQPALRVPKHQAYAMVNWQMVEQAAIWTQLRYTGERTDYNWLFANYPTLDSYITLDVGARYQVTDALALNLGVNNLLDEDYESVTGFGQLGRTASLIISYSL